MIHGAHGPSLTADGMGIAERAVTIRNDERDNGADSEGQSKRPGNSEGGSCERDNAVDARHRAGAEQVAQGRHVKRRWSIVLKLDLERSLPARLPLKGGKLQPALLVR